MNKRKIAELNAVAGAWLAVMDFYLWCNAIKTRRAVAMAKEDGIEITAARLGRLAAKSCEWWKHEFTPRVGKATALTSTQWALLMDWLRTHQETAGVCGSLRGLCRRARYSGIRCSPKLMLEAMSALNLTVKIPPQWGKPEFRKEKQPVCK